jgi:cyclase
MSGIRTVNRELKVWGIGVALLAGAVASTAQDRDWSKVEMKTVPIGPGLVMIQGAGGNLALSFGDDGAFVVDDQFAPLHEKILAAVKAQTPKAVRFVVNTHYHGDHTGGNEKMGSTGAVIVAHDNVRKRLSTEQFSTLWNEKTPPAPAGAWPVVTFADSVTFHVNGETVRVQHVAPAHTDGDSIVWFEKANAVHMGDVFFRGRYPYLDLDAGGSLAGAIADIEQVIGKVNDQTKVIPGHGDVSSRKDLVDYRDTLAGIRDAVAKLIAAGKSEDEAVAAKPTAPWDAVWGGGFIKPDIMVRTAYRSLAAGAKK